MPVPPFFFLHFPYIHFACTYFALYTLLDANVYIICYC